MKPPPSSHRQRRARHQHEVHHVAALHVGHEAAGRRMLTSGARGVRGVGARGAQITRGGSTAPPGQVAAPPAQFPSPLPALNLPDGARGRRRAGGPGRWLWRRGRTCAPTRVAICGEATKAGRRRQQHRKPHEHHAAPEISCVCGRRAARAVLRVAVRRHAVRPRPPLPMRALSRGRWKRRLTTRGALATALHHLLDRRARRVLVVHGQQEVASRARGARRACLRRQARRRRSRRPVGLLEGEAESRCAEMSTCSPSSKVKPPPSCIRGDGPRAARPAPPRRRPPRERVADGGGERSSRDEDGGAVRQGGVEAPAHYGHHEVGGVLRRRLGHEEACRPASRSARIWSAAAAATPGVRRRAEGEHECGLVGGPARDGVLERGRRRVEFDQHRAAHRAPSNGASVACPRRRGEPAVSIDEEEFGPNGSALVRESAAARARERRRQAA